MFSNEERILIELIALADELNRSWIEVLDRCLEQKEIEESKVP